MLDKTFGRVLGRTLGQTVGQTQVKLKNKVKVKFWLSFMSKYRKTQNHLTLGQTDVKVRSNFWTNSESNSGQTLGHSLGLI